jgi:hypothetical protein
MADKRVSKSPLAVSLDALQGQLHSSFRQAGFRKHGRTYNRSTSDGLTHVVGFQMGAFDPPGTTYIPGLRENLYGRFIVNLGVYVPEVARNHGGGEPKSVIHDYNCCIRTRLGRTDSKEFWWKVSTSDVLAAELLQRFENEVLPFFQRFESRDQILREFGAEPDNTPLMAVPRIVCAIILLGQGDREAARSLLAAQAREHTRNPHHPVYVVGLAKRLGIEITS